MRIAITGANGRLAKELLALDWQGADILTWTRADADLSQWEPTQALFQRDRPDVVIHTAASTDLVKCEQDKQYAWENVAMPAVHVARGCVETGARLVHVSTDYVFSGNEPVHPIPKGTRPEPLNYYSFCKVAGETAARVVPDHLVIRTTMKPRAPWKHAQAPVDMWLSHSYYDEVAAYIRKVALTDRRGILQHGARQINVYEFAKQERPDVMPIKREDVKTLTLPSDVRLEVDEE